MALLIVLLLASAVCGVMGVVEGLLWVGPLGMGLLLIRRKRCLELDQQLNRSRDGLFVARSTNVGHRASSGGEPARVERRRLWKEKSDARA